MYRTCVGTRKFRGSWRRSHKHVGRLKGTAICMLAYYLFQACYYSRGFPLQSMAVTAAVAQSTTCIMFFKRLFMPRNLRGKSITFMSSLVVPPAGAQYTSTAPRVDCLLERVLQIIEKMDDSVRVPKFWVPLVWANSVVTRARKEGRIKDDFALKSLLGQLDKFRSKAGVLLDYDWIPIPLVYTQVGL